MDDGARLNDTFIVEINGASSRTQSLSRPAESAVKADWVRYAVQLGADENFITGNTTYWHSGVDNHVQSHSLTKEQLIELALSLGG